MTYAHENPNPPPAANAPVVQMQPTRGQSPPDTTLLEIAAHTLDPAQWATMKLTQAMGADAPQSIGDAHRMIEAVLREALVHSEGNNVHDAPNA